MIMNYVPAATAEGAAPPEHHSYIDAWSAYTKATMDTGVMRGGNALNPGYTGTTVRLRDGRRDVHDRPYADSKEELGRYYIIEVPDLEVAPQWRRATRLHLLVRSKCGRS